MTRMAIRFGLRTEAAPRATYFVSSNTHSLVNIVTGTAHEREEHYAPSPTSECSVCHVPLATSGFDRARVEALPVPSDHEDLRFLHAAGEAEHAAGAATPPARN